MRKDLSLLAVAIIIIGLVYFIPLVTAAGIAILIAVVLLRNVLKKDPEVSESKRYKAVMSVAIVLIVVFSGISLYNHLLNSTVSRNSGVSGPFPPGNLTGVTTLRAQGYGFNYTPNGTILAENQQSSTLYGMVYTGITFNVSNEAVITGSWKSTSDVAAVFVPVAYEHNLSSLGKVLSVQKTAVSGNFDNQFGTAAGITVQFVLLFFPLPGQNGTVTFTTPLVLKEYQG